MNIMVTGHRPNGMPGRYGYTISNEAWTKLQQKFEEVIEQYTTGKNEETITLITGMALGVDQVFWNAANNLREEYPDVYKIEAAIPFKGQESKWFATSQREYRRMLDNSDEVTIVSPGCYSAAKMDIRNRYMVDKSDLVIGVCCKNTGGTANCLRYAKSKHKDICVINPNTLDIQFFKGYFKRSVYIMENKNLKFSLLDYYIEKRKVAPENVEDKIREDMDIMGLSAFADYFNIYPIKDKNYDCLNAGEYNEIFHTRWHIEFDDFDGSIDIEPMNVDEYTVPFIAEAWELMLRGDVEIKLGITDDHGYLDADEFDYLLQERRTLHRKFYYHCAQDSICYYIDTTKSDGSIYIKEATDKNKKTLAFHMAEKAGYIYSTYDAAKRAASHLAYAFNRKLV